MKDFPHTKGIGTLIGRQDPSFPANRILVFEDAAAPESITLPL
jgi:hypothetical protein